MIKNKISTHIFFGFMVICMVALPILKFVNLHTSYFDLGVFNHISYNFDMTHNIYEMFLGHIHGYAFLTSLLYKFYNSALVLLVFQSVAILSSLYFIHKLSPNHILRNYFFLTFVLLYAVWYNVLFDFHYDHLVIPLGFLFYYFAYVKKFKSALAVSIFISLIKEPFALMTSFMGLYLIVKHKRYAIGMIMIFYGFFYFYVATHYIIPFFTPSYGMLQTTSHLFGEGGTLFDIAMYPFLHFPTFIINIVTTKKILYLIVLLCSFGIIVVFFSWVELIPATPFIAIAMLANVENYYWYNTHYTAPLIAPFMVAFILGLPKCIQFLKAHVKYIDTTKKGLGILLIPIILAHIVFSPSPFSRFFWINKLPEYHYTSYLFSERTQNIRQALLKYIPYDVNISVSSQNSIHSDHIAHREHFFIFPYGALESVATIFVNSDSFLEIANFVLEQKREVVTIKYVSADYVIVDLKRPLYNVDKSLTEQEFLKILLRLQKDYEVIYSYDDFSILKRKTNG